jgi:poly(A) polymerase
MSTESENLTKDDAPRDGGGTEGRRPVIVERGDHCISRRLVPENTLKVLYRLHRSGFRAYLCGGSVRDLLMNRTPKDFDVVTDAHPMAVRRLFRNSRVIGRRFRLVHVMFQDGVVEVSTYRKEPEARSDDELLVTDDNTFGTPEEDAKRRDFTVNALFYNIADFSIIDYVGGLEDLDEHLIRVIGNPDIRFREDPVRMMRAVEFAARLDFEIEADTWDAIVRHQDEILKASPARVSEELLELLRRGWSLEAFELLMETGLLRPLLPELVEQLGSDESEYFWRMLEVLDRTIQSGRSFPDWVYWSVMLLPCLVRGVDAEERLKGGKLGASEAMGLIRDVSAPVSQRMTLAAGTRHRVEQLLETLWRMQDPPHDRRSDWRLVLREDFPSALAVAELFALSSGRRVEEFRAWHSFANRVRHQDAPPPKPRRRGGRGPRRR